MNNFFHAFSMRFGGDRTKRIRLRFALTLCLGAVFVFLISSQAADAKAPPTFRATEIDRTPFSALVMTPGSTQTISLTFKNTGTATWQQNGRDRVAINTDFPNARSSKFRDASWSSLYRPARLPSASIKPNETATFTFTLHAPDKKGEYVERLYLVSLSKGKIPGGEISFLITVGDKAPSIPLFRGKYGSISENAYSFLPGQAKTVSVQFVNTGRSTWNIAGRNPVLLETANPRLRKSDFQHKWIDAGHPNVLKGGAVKPGQTITVRFALKAPTKEGLYTESFQLVSKNLAPVEGTQFDVTILVKIPPPDPLPPGTGLISEPNIRVGITYLNTGVVLKSTTPGTYTTNAGASITRIEANIESTITYANGTYTLKTPSASFTSTVPLRLTPDAGGVTSVVNYRTNYDTFRGVVEVQFATATNRLWVINELPFEQYLAGLAEAVTGQPTEYIRSLAVAARSYALWHWYVSSKHRNENFSINSTTDQVYKGYYYELKTPDFVKAVQDTRGIVMTHPSAGFDKNPLNVALGAYSSGTDGRTRSFTEVWGGKPEDWEWLVSVPDPLGIIPNATTRTGNHMVGMSATGALRFASQQGKTYDWILTYYYTGITLQQFY